MNISILSGYKESDIWSIPISFANEFQRQGYQIRFYNTINNNAEGISQLDPRAWTEEGLIQLLDDAKSGKFIPDIVFHCDFGLFQSPLLNKKSFPSAKWVCEAGDDPQCFQYNLRKIEAGNFDLIHSPDIRAVQQYVNKGYNAVWGPHFADQSLLEGITQEPIYDAVTSRHIGEDFFSKLKRQLGNRFEARTIFLEGKEHLRHLMKGKIVIQNSKYKEISRRLFEGIICNRLVIADRPDTTTQIDLIFKENEDIVYFDSVEECLDKINYYSKNDTERLRISKNGYDKVIINHTVQKRVYKIIQLCNITLKK